MKDTFDIRSNRFHTFIPLCVYVESLPICPYVILRCNSFIRHYVQLYTAFIDILSLPQTATCACKCKHPPSVVERLKLIFSFGSFFQSSPSKFGVNTCSGKNYK